MESTRYDGRFGTRNPDKNLYETMPVTDMFWGDRFGQGQAPSVVLVDYECG